MLNQGFRLWGFQKIIGGTASSGKVQLGLLGPRNTKCPATEQKKNTTHQLYHHVPFETKAICGFDLILGHQIYHEDQ
jgi:hypothetical protein